MALGADKWAHYVSPGSGLGAGQQAHDYEDTGRNDDEGLAIIRPRVVHDTFTRVLKFEPNIGEEIRADDVAAGDRYHGLAVDGTATSAAGWSVVRFYRDTAGNVTRVRYKASISWDSRATAGNWP